MIRIVLRISLVTLVIALFAASSARAQGDQPLPTPPGPDSQPSTAPPTAPKQGDDPGSVPPPPPKDVVKKPVKVAAAVRREADVPVRANGNWGAFFRFGGLATLTQTGNTRLVAPGLALTHVGLKYAPSETWMFPIYAGTALGIISPENGDSVTSFGIEAGGGVEYHFRIWRRISPYVGASAGIFYTNPSGTDNWTVGFGLGPVLGVEYYIADRLSLQAQYTFVIALAAETLPSGPNAAATRTSVGLFTSAGGALNLTYYF